MIATIDFETYSASDYNTSIKGKWGLPETGACVYSEHESTDIVSLAYKFQDGVKIWFPGEPYPQDLFTHILKGGLVEAWNVGFERWIWENVAVKKYNFPEIPFFSYRCCMAKAKHFSMPASLDEISKVLNLQNKKLSGKKLIDKFCKPSKKILRTYLLQDQDSLNFIEYNKKDVEAEFEASHILPELSNVELKFWQLDQKINKRGIGIDVEAVDGALKMLPIIYEHYNKKTAELTESKVTSLFQVARIKQYCLEQGFALSSLSKPALEKILQDAKIPKKVSQLLEYRLLTCSTTVKKIPKIKKQLSKKGRIHDNFSYYGAHTGRATGLGVQVQNLPQGNSKIFASALPYILASDVFNAEQKFGNVVKMLSDCLRGFIKAKEGYEFICSDYSAIEAVVLACLAGEDWRVEVFRTHGMIYELSASKVLSIPFKDFLDFKNKYNENHPARKIGKILDLAFGYAGGVGAYLKAMGDKNDIEDGEIERLKQSWRQSNSKITKFWHKMKEGFETALKNPGIAYSYRAITFLCKNNAIYCKLPSGRNLVYHEPKLKDGDLSYSGTRKGKWVNNIKLHGGVLTENIVQAVSRDILMYALYNLEKAGYEIVMHVHDEAIAEVPLEWGSVEEFESIMNSLPRFCVYDDGMPWPIKAKGGWKNQRFGKY